MTEARDLYGLPLERFVPERSALAKALLASGERQQAERVAKLRKPSVAAWAVNQLVRTQRAEVGRLFGAGDELQEAQGALLAGRSDADALRAAAERERAAVELLTNTARGLLTSEGHELSATTVERVGETLHAAALDRDARAQVADGCLERELHHVGLGGGQASDAAPRRGAAKARPNARSRGVERERDERLKAARKAAADAQRAAERATRELRAAEERRDRAAAALQAAETTVTEARQRAREAERDRRQLERALTEALERRRP